MKSFNSILVGEKFYSSGYSITGDQNLVIQEINKRYKEIANEVILLFEYGDLAKGFLVKTRTRILFCLTQNESKFSSTFEIKWFIDDISTCKFDIKLIEVNEIQITEGKNVLFDPNFVSASRMIREISNMILPPKTTISEEIKREVKVHPKIWSHIAKMYEYYYKDVSKDVLLSLPLKTDASNVTKVGILKFFLSLPLEDGLKVIKDILENEDVKRDKSNNWNERGEFIKNWRPQLIGFLKDNGIEYDDISGTFSLSGGEPILISTTKRKLQKLLDIEFNDFFYDNLEREINSSYRFGLFTSTMILSRKLLENLVIEILRTKYPQSVPANLDIYYSIKGNRFHDFTVLLKNLEDRKNDFTLDTQIVSEFISSIKPFRPTANSNAHSIIIASKEEDTLNYEIPKMTALLFKLWNNLKN